MSALSVPEADILQMGNRPHNEIRVLAFYDGKGSKCK
jgi:hypothetical protein